MTVLILAMALERIKKKGEWGRGELKDLNDQGSRRSILNQNIKRRV